MAPVRRPHRYVQDGMAQQQAGRRTGRGFEVTQTVPAGLVRIRPPDKKSIHWHGLHSLGTTIRPNCFAIRFATYKRTNAGKIETSWRQGNVTQSWRVAAADLVDNEFVDFCPRGGIDTDRASLISIRGVDGQAGQCRHRLAHQIET